jgi:hypothetical protein
MAAQDKRRRGTARGLVRPRDAVLTVVVTLALAALFNADNLVRGAETKPYGADRERWLRIWRPVQGVSDRLFLDKPAAAIEFVTGHGTDNSPTFSFPDPAVAAEVASPTPASAAGAPPTPTPIVRPSPTPLPTVRVPTAGKPLRLWVGGDSLAGIFGQSLVRDADETGVIEGTLDYKIATGLTRPDYFDWPKEFAQVTRQLDPDIMVIVFGSNDSQGLRDPQGGTYQPMTDGWRAEYRRRVAQTMDFLQRPGRIIVWVGLPAMRDDRFSRALEDLDAIYRQEAQKRPWVVYVDARVVMGEAAGAYAPYLPDSAGHMEAVREPDGVHYTRAGGDRLSAAVMDAISARVQLTHDEGVVSLGID